MFYALPVGLLLLAVAAIACVLTLLFLAARTDIPTAAIRGVLLEIQRKTSIASRQQPSYIKDAQLKNFYPGG